MAVPKCCVSWGPVFCAMFVVLFVVQATVALPQFEDYSDADYTSAETLPDKRHVGSIAAQSGIRAPFMRPQGLFSELDNNMKMKRFLGSLARGGWFPRQFRGFVNNPGSQSGYQQKRHIGAVARMGWLPRSREDYHY